MGDYWVPEPPEPWEPPEISFSELQRPFTATQVTKDGTSIVIDVVMGVPPSIGYPRITELRVRRADGETLRAVDIRSISIEQLMARRNHLLNMGPSPAETETIEAVRAAAAALADLLGLC